MVRGSIYWVLLVLGSVCCFKTIIPDWRTSLLPASGGNLVGSLANIFVTGGGPSSIISETFVSSGLYRISYSIANVPVVAAAVEAGTEISQLGVAWQVSVKDVSGNEARSSARNLIVDTTTPVLQGAFAGDNWDATNNRLASSDPSRKFGADSRTSIRVEFDKAMDGSSFDTGDFLVDGVAPTGVDHFAGSAVNVFLTVAEMAPDATPFIQIVGVVRDDGGNPLSTGSVTADDDMAPRVTLTFDDGRNATTGDIKLRIVSDEALATAIPFIDIRLCVSNIMCTAVTSHILIVKVVRNRLEWTFDLKVTTIGLHNMLVRGIDVHSNEGVDGVASVIDSTRPGDPRAPGALLF